MPRLRPITALPTSWLRGFGLLAAILVIGRAAPVTPLDSPMPDGEFATNSTQWQSVAAVTKTAKAEWLLAPIPSLSPSQGAGLQVVAARLFQPAGARTTTPPSVLGVAGLYTQEKSYAVGAGYSGHLDDDRWRVTAGAGYLRFNSDYYGVGDALGRMDLAIPIEQRATLGLAQAMRRIGPGLYAGVRGLAARTTVTAQGPAQAPITLPELAASADMHAGSPVFQWDTRDDNYGPTSGRLLDARTDIFGGAFHYRSTTVTLNEYRPLGRGVLAWRGYVQVIDGRAPFFALCSFGGGSDLRGYTSGRYRDRAMVAAQAEYRWRLSPRWGLVAFAGAGQVGPTLGSLPTHDLLASAGGGLRYRLTKENPVNLRCDFAWGRDGGALYIGVGEAF